MAKNTFLDWDTTASNNTDIGGIGILGSNAVKNFDDAFRTLMAQLRRDIDGEVVYAAKSGNYTAVANDNNAWHRYTATATVSLTAAATLGANWHYIVSAVGASTVLTIDPNASETIGGVTTLVLHGGQTAFIICDGTNFQVEIRGTAYVAQSGGYTALLGDKGTQQRFSAAATLALTAAATLGSGWTMDVFADGGDVTIDPNASETVNGSATLIVPNGSSGTLWCNGSNFFFVMSGVGLILLKSIDLTGAASTAGAFTDLSASLFDQYKIEVINAVPATGAVDMYLENSTNNGSSYGATADVNWYRGQQSTNSATPTYTNATADTKTIMANNISNTANLSGFRGDITIFMSSSGRIAAQFTFGGHTGAIEYGGAGSGFFAASSNAFRVRPSSGNWTSGRINLYGIRH